MIFRNNTKIQTTSAKTYFIDYPESFVTHIESRETILVVSDEGKGIILYREFYNSKQKR